MNDKSPHDPADVTEATWTGLIIFVTAMILLFLIFGTAIFG